MIGSTYCKMVSLLSSKSKYCFFCTNPVTFAWFLIIGDVVKFIKSHSKTQMGECKHMIIYFFVFQIHNEGISRIKIEEQEFWSQKCSIFNIIWQHKCFRKRLNKHSYFVCVHSISTFLKYYKMALQQQKIASRFCNNSFLGQLRLFDKALTTDWIE